MAAAAKPDQTMYGITAITIHPSGVDCYYYVHAVASFCLDLTV